MQSLIIATTAFALGFGARNIASGLHPLAMNLLLPASTSPVNPGEFLIVECGLRPEYGRRVRVLADGTIALKSVGTIDISGQDIAEIEKTVKAAYKKHFKDSTSSSIEVFRGDASQPLK